VVVVVVTVVDVDVVTVTVVVLVVVVGKHVSAVEQRTVNFASISFMRAMLDTNSDLVCSV
jgi:hypothetical protein